MLLAKGRKIGVKVLGVYLVAAGVAPYLRIDGTGLILSLLAIAAGVLLRTDR